jgi:regulation of enolase protein 1 (concanavalin A-like superfamily)
LRRNGQVERSSPWEQGVLDHEKPGLFRLDRKGNDFTASYSQDGKEWKEMPPITTDFGTKLGVGVAAIQNTPAGYEAIFESLKITPGKKAE